MKRPWALITGASSGIGYRYAEELASRGYDLVIVSNENAALRDAAARVANGYGVEVRPLYMDLAAADAADALFAACRHEELKISVLVVLPMSTTSSPGCSSPASRRNSPTPRRGK